MKQVTFAKLLLLIALLFFANLKAFPQQVSVDYIWIPPMPRLKERTIFAPKPFTGNNIFKNDADGWLADAIENVEIGYLSPIKDQEIADYISKLGKNLVIYSTKPKKDYKFIVLNDERVNAFTIGGGRIYINIGTLREVENEDELVGVLAHEIGHDAFAHVAKTVTRQLFWMLGERKVKTAEDAETGLKNLLKEYEKKPLAAIGEALLGFRKLNELEADRAAFYDVFNAGYNPRHFKRLMDRVFKEQEKDDDNAEFIEKVLNLLFATHPPTSQRITALKWESNFVKMPPNDSFYKNAAFDAMKAKVK